MITWLLQLLLSPKAFEQDGDGGVRPPIPPDPPKGVTQATS